MNINEVEKHVKSEFIITVILYILVGLCMIVSIIAIVATPVKALTDTDISSSIYTGTQHTISSSPGMAMADDQVTNDVYSTITQNEWTAGVLSIYFQVNTGIPANKNVTIRINTSSTLKNLRYTCNSTHVSCSAVYISNNQLNINFTTGSSPVTYAGFFISTENSSYISGQDLFRWTSVRLLTNDVSSGGSGGGSSSGSFDDSGIINNANSNTQDIINNANSNTNTITNNQDENTIQTIDSINLNATKILQLVNELCLNLLDFSKFTADSNVTLSGVNANNGTFTINTSSAAELGVWTDYIPINTSLTYYFRANLTNYTTAQGWRIYMYQYDSNKNQLTSYRITNNQVACQNQSSCFTARTRYVRLHITTNEYGGSRTWSSAVFAPTPINSTYCKYGTVGANKFDLINGSLGTVNSSINTTNNKLDQQITIEQQQKNLLEQQKNLQEQQNNYLMDDTNPTVNSSDINNVISNVQVQDPLNYLLTLPINLLTKLNTLISSGTCNKASFGTLYGTELYLPCINFENYLGSSLWTTIDTIVGIGLLVVILKKFYDTISNILSLGKEEEIRKGMELPTPMEFLAQILGGGR